MPNRIKGLWAAAFFILFASTSPSVTRYAVIRTLTVYDLMVMRSAIGALIFFPYLIAVRKHLSLKVLSIGFLMSALQGWGVNLMVICGMQYAPSGHISALGPGVSPMWVMLVGYILNNKIPSKNQVISSSVLLLGAIFLLLGSGFLYSDLWLLLGDSLFLLSSFTSAFYIVYMERREISPMLGAALISFFSGIVVVPMFFIFHFPTAMDQASNFELTYQGVYQGFFIGVLIFFLIGYSISNIGSSLFVSLSASIPLISMIIGHFMNGDEFRAWDIFSICLVTCGLLLGISRTDLKKPQT